MLRAFRRSIPHEDPFDAERRPDRCRGASPQGSDDRPARPSVWRRRVAGPAGRGVRARMRRGSSPWRLHRSGSVPRSVCAGRSMARSGAGSSGSLSLPPTTPEHEYPPRFAQTLGSVALILSLVAFAARRGARWAGCSPLAVAGLQIAAGRDRLLPGLPAVLPALVGAGPRDPDLDPRRGPALAGARWPGADQLPLNVSAGSARTSGLA